MRVGNDYVSALDLKSAYDLVDRNKLLTICDNLLPKILVRTISLTLGPISVRTIGDPTTSQSVSRCGVIQGSPLSPILFNVYIDPSPMDYVEDKLGIAPTSRKLYANDCHQASLQELRKNLTSV